MGFKFVQSKHTTSRQWEDLLMLVSILKLCNTLRLTFFFNCIVILEINSILMSPALI